MTSDEALQVAAAALSESVLVVGRGDVGEAAAERVAARDVPATDDAPEPDALVLAVDASDVSDRSPTVVPAASGVDAPADVPISVAVVTLPSRPMPDEREALAALADGVDAVVLAPGSPGDVPADGTAATDDAGVRAIVDAVATLVSVVRDPGFVNVDLADARTVFEPVSLAALGVGESSNGRPAEAVADAFASLPSGLETDPASGVLVDLQGGPAMSVEDVSDAVSAVRGRVGPDAHVIWGGGVDGTLAETVQVRLVLAGVGNGRAAPGDPCPRCGTALAAYTLGARTSLSCDGCGYAGVSVRLRE